MTATLQRPVYDRVRTGSTAIAQDLANLTIAQTVDAAAQLWERMDLCPGSADPFLDRAEAIARQADDRGIIWLDDLVGDAAAEVLSAAAETMLPLGNHAAAPSTARLDPAVLDPAVRYPDELDRLHSHRNTISALRATALAFGRGRERIRMDRPERDTLAFGLPVLPDRVQAPSRPTTHDGKQRKRVAGRPLTDDEVLLGNLLGKIDVVEAIRTRDLYQANAFQLAISGGRQMELTTTTIASFDDLTNPTTFSTSGLWDWQGRTVSLTPCASDILAESLRRFGPDRPGVCYGGSVPGTKAAAASVANVLKGYLRRAGITGTDLTPESVSLWRPMHLLRTGAGAAAARTIHGGDSKHLLSSLGLRHVTTSDRRHADLLDHCGDVVARVAIHELYDRI